MLAHVMTIYNYLLHLHEQSQLTLHQAMIHFYKEVVLFLSLELLGIIIMVAYITSILRYAIPLTRFRALAEQLSTDINAPITGLQPFNSTLVVKTTDAVSALQKQVQMLINKRTKMLAAISHDLRIPLTRLRMRAELVDDPDFTEEMLADVDEMSAMISDILTFARGDVFHEQRDDVDLYTLLYQIYEDFKQMGYAIHFQCEDGHYCVSGYRMALKRVFNNLVENALKYGDEAWISLKKTDKHINISVDDNGPGIATHALAHIFDAYYRADLKEKGGTGLGLNTAHEIITIHGGDIRLTNKEPHGIHAEVILAGMR